MLKTYTNKYMETSNDAFSIDVSDKLQIVNPNEKKPLVHVMNSGADVYETISYFLGMKSSDEPFYIVNLSEVQYWYNQFVKLLPRVRPFYAIKSCPDPMIIDVLAKLGCGFDCASKDEIVMAKSTGADKESILYANPVKDVESLQFARSQDVDYITFDSECELDKIKVFHPDALCIIRIKVDDSGAEYKLGDKFGASFEDSEENVESLLNIAKIRKINVVGISFHVGSRTSKLGQFEKALKDARRACDVGKKCGFDLKLIDCGGGFINNEDPNNGTTFEQVANEINQAIDKYFSDIEGIRFIAEPGRLFCTTSHTLVTTIIGFRTIINNKTNEKEYIYTIHESVYGSFNCLVFDNAKPTILPFNERNEKTFRSVIYGRTCDSSSDIITKEIFLPKLTVGDKLLVENFGSYTVGVKIKFNGFTEPKIHYIIKN